MKRCINIHTQIIVSTQFFTNNLPKEFNYTCFFWLPSCGIFNKYSKLVACGTQEGPIVIIGKKINDTKLANENIKNSKFEFVSLLSGHTTAITDIRILNKTNTFLSVSKDSQICGWSFLDYSCEFQFKLNLNYGDYFFSICTMKYDNIWLIRYGESISLIDLTSGVIIKQLFYPGIKSFEVIYPSIKNKMATAICIGPIQTTFYNIDDKFEFTEIKTVLNNEKLEKNEVIKICQLGIIKIVGNIFRIYKPNSKLKIIYQGAFAQLPTDDFIKTVHFDQNHMLFVAGSYLGRFFIVNLQKFLEKKLKTLQIQYVYPFANQIPKRFYIISNFAINDQGDVIFSSGSKQIYYTNTKNQNVKLEKDDDDDYGSDVSFVKNAESTFFLRSHGSLLSFILFSTQKAFRTIQFHKKITAIFERKNKTSELCIGFNDGKICFLTNHAKFVTILTDSVQCFVSTMYTSDLLAIGRDGSACLFYSDGTFIAFDTPHLPIIRVYYIPHLDLFCFGLDDASFLVYSSKSSSLVEITMKLPRKSSLIWPEKVEESVFSEKNVYASVCAKFRTKMVVYRKYDIPSLCRVVRENYFQYQQGMISNTKKRERIKEIINLSNFLFDLMENKITNNNGYNLAFIGANQKPTFFYPSFKYNGQMICELSPFLGSSQFISYHLLSEACNRDTLISSDIHFFNSIQFLPVLLQFIYFPDDDVQRIVCTWCITLCNYVSFQKCQEYLIPFTILDNLDNVEEYDKFLMSILIVRYPNTLPSSFISELYEFLDELTITSSEQAVLALSILIEGISLWESKTEKKESIFVTIIESMLRQTRSFFLCNKFYNIACSDITSFFKAFPILISSSAKNDENVQNILNLYSNVAYKNPKLIGAVTSDLFAKQCSKFPQLKDLFLNAIESHSKIFQFVCMVDDTFLIGLPESEVHVYQGGKLLLKERIFEKDTDISFVDIGPDKKCAVAVSERLKKAILFYLSENTKRLFKSKKSLIFCEFDVPSATHNCIFNAEWFDSQNCRVYATAQ